MRALCLLLALPLLACQPQSAERAEDGAAAPEALPVSPAPSPGERAQRMLTLLNQERQERGLEPLAWSGELAAVAEAHSRDMLERQYFAHVDPDGQALDDRARKAGIRFRMIGENLGLAPSAELAHQTLMQSPSHRENMLKPEYREAGIGVVEIPEGQDFKPTHRDQALPVPPGGLSGYLIVTQVFRR